MTLQVPRIPYDENSIAPAVLIGHDGSDYRLVYSDSDGNLQVRNLVYDSDSMEWVAAQGSTGTGTEVEVVNWPALFVTEARKLTPRVEISGNTIYVGEAAIGSAENASAWRIQKFDLSGTIEGLWADGNSNFDNRWDQRAALSYS